jgi:hypothetical protein
VTAGDDLNRWADVAESLGQDRQIVRVVANVRRIAPRTRRAALTCNPANAWHEWRLGRWLSRVAQNVFESLLD